MANSLLKWCKTKIFNGYKHINVEATEEMATGNRSDTEYLVRGPEEFLLTAPDQRYSCSSNEVAYSMAGSPGAPLERRKTRVTSRQGMDGGLRLTEEDCEKREFAFTLYDFHGQGRVTKDDIASLVQSIYETMGSSLSLPPSGSRTVQVKLSVVPFEENLSGHESACNRTCARAPTTYSAPLRICQDWNSASAFPSETLVEDDRSRIEGESCSQPKDYTFDFSSRCSTLKEVSSPRQQDVLSTQLFEAEEAESPIEGVTPRRGRRKKSRKVHYQRQELLEMIQASMEKNNLFYPRFRNSLCHHPQNHGQHHRRRKRPQQHHHLHCGCCCRCCCTTNSQKCASSGGSSIDPTMLKARLMHYDVAVCSKNKASPSAESSALNADDKSGVCCERMLDSSRAKYHHRSRSQDLNTDSPHVFRHHLLEPPTHQHHPLPPSNTPDRPPTSPRLNQHQHSHNHHHHLAYRHRSRSCENEEPIKEKGQLYHQNNGDNITLYPFNLQSKYKVKLDHQRAMNEVVSWMEKTTFKELENDHERNKDKDDNLIRASRKTIFTAIDSDSSLNNSSKPHDEKNDTTISNDAEDSSLNTSGCGRSQHVHQHFHHHYYHYPSTPLII